MKNIQSIQRYIGAASDTKPTAVEPGSEFLEYDTKEHYITYDGTNWERNDIFTYTYPESIAEGIRTNHSAWFKTGFNPAITTTAEDVWGNDGLYQFIVSASGLEVVSSATGDTVNGAGVRSVRIYYLNASYEEKTELVNMNGTSAAATASVDFYRVNWVNAESVGSSSVALGNIDVRDASDSPVYGRISAGFTRSRDLIYTVPKDKELYLGDSHYSVVHTAANKFTLMTLRSNYDRLASVSSALFFPESTIILDAGMADVDFKVPLKFSEKTDLRITASSNGTAAVAITLRGWIETE